MNKKSVSPPVPLPGIQMHEWNIDGKAVDLLREKQLLIDHNEWGVFFEELQGETNRAAAILVAAWLDELLKRKLQILFCHGSKTEREELFESNGPFRSFGNKISALSCLGHLDAETCNDLRLIKAIRNKYAHHIQGLSMDTPKIAQWVEALKTPDRVYHDWRTLRASTLKDGSGIVIYTGESSEEVGEPLSLSALRFRLASSLIITYTAANLGVHFVLPNDSSSVEEEE